jgi:hypothetical protein
LRPAAFSLPGLPLEGPSGATGRAFFFSRAAAGPLHDQAKEARMGGLLKAPKPLVMAEPSPAARTETTAEATAQTAATADTAGREARIRAVERARRGLAGTVATSARGVLDPAPAFAARKSLLGE